MDSDRLELRRGPASRAQRETFIVFLERGLPETYLQWVKKALQHHQMTERYADAGDEAVQIIARAARAGRDAKVKGSEFDHVWCLFEGVSASAVAELRLELKSKVDLASSDPGIELWLLLHFQDVDSDQPLDEIRDALRKHLSNPQNDIVDGALRGRYLDALTRAKALSAQNAPSTDVFVLVEQVRASLRAFDPEASERI